MHPRAARRVQQLHRCALGAAATLLRRLSCRGCALSRAQLKEGMYVWVKDPSIAGSDLYTKGHILNINSNKITVETSNSVKTQELILPAQECFHICPEGDVPDHCQLLYLSQPTMLENTRKRFKVDGI